VTAGTSDAGVRAGARSERTLGPAGAGVSDAPEDDSARGTTTILPRVVERVAIQAVREVPAAAGSGRQLLGHGVGSRGIADPATVRAHVDGSVTSLDVELSVIYPAPVLGVTRRARHHIIDRIVGLTGLSVRRVDITVVGMTVERPSRRVR
jgi:uncharacterized alkaline shock family protein YloU